MKVDGWVCVPREATRTMCARAVTFANGDAVYKNVAAPALEIEERIYGEAYEAMLSAAPTPSPVPVDPTELAALRELDRLARVFAKQQPGTQEWSLRALYLHEHVNAALAANGEKAG